MTEKWHQYGILIHSDTGVVCELSEPHPASGLLEHIRPDYGSPDRDEIAANGRLIVAAPQLAEALRAVEWIHCSEESYCPWCGEWPHAPRCAREAALARLEEP